MFIFMADKKTPRVTHAGFLIRQYTERLMRRGGFF